MRMISILAKSRLRYYKSRTILTVIAVFLTTMLLNGIVVSTIGIVDLNRQSAAAAGNMHAVFFNLSVGQMQMLKNHLEVEQLAVSESVADIEYGKMNGHLIYEEEVRGDSGDADGGLSEGHRPEAADEICGPAAFFERMDVEPKIGNQIEISFRPSGLNGLGEIQTETFTICGLTPSAIDVSELDIADTRVAWGAEISEAFVSKILPEEERIYRASLRIYGEEDSRYEEMEARLNALAEEIGVPERDVWLNQSYLYTMLTPPVDVIGVGCMIAVLVIFFAALIIYSIYYVNVITDIQEIGKLKALGAGDRQIRRLFLREGMFCSLIAVPSGLLAGFAIPYIALPYIAAWIMNVNVLSSARFTRTNLFSLPLTLLVAAVVLTAVFLSLIKPIRIATGVSPVTAIRYQEGSTAKKFRKGYNRIGVVRLCLANLSRNRKRTMVTMLSMGLSWVLFMGMSGVLSSVSADDIADRRLLDGAEFRIELDYRMEDIVYPENEIHHVQIQNLLGAELAEKIRALEGVETVKGHKEVLARVKDAPEDNYYYSGQGHDLAILGTVDESRAEKFKEDVKKGKIDYEKMSEENGVIFCMDYYIDEVGLSVGDQIDLTLYDGDREIPFTGTIAASIGSADYEDFLITEETYKKLGIEADTATSLLIEMEGPTIGSAYEKRYEAAKEALTEMVGERERLSLISRDEEMRMGRMSVSVTVYPAYALLIMIAVISMMSLINTMVISITTRTRELGMLQAVGLSDKQLVRMLSGEGMFFTSCTLVLSFTLGNALGYQLFQWAKGMGFMSIHRYRYPMLETLLLCIAMVVGQLLIVLFVKKKVGRESVIDRIRSGE